MIQAVYDSGRLKRLPLLSQALPLSNIESHIFECASIIVVNNRKDSDASAMNQKLPKTETSSDYSSKYFRGATLDG